jgi:hypothetical protein
MRVLEAELGSDMCNWSAGEGDAGADETDASCALRPRLGRGHQSMREGHFRRRLPLVLISARLNSRTAKDRTLLATLLRGQCRRPSYSQGRGALLAGGYRRGEGVE